MLSVERNHEDIKRIFDKQKQFYSPAKPLSFEDRIDLLNRIETMTRNHMDEITRALQKDFGTRSSDWIFTADFYPVLEHVIKVKN